MSATQVVAVAGVTGYLESFVADVSTWSFGYLEYFVTTRNTTATKWKPGLKSEFNFDYSSVAQIAFFSPKTRHCRDRDKFYGN